MNKEELEKYKVVQDITKNTIEHLKTFICEGVIETEISQEAEQFMKNNGVDSFWYHNVGALVLVGERTNLSVSGRDYKSSNAQVSKTDLVTVDLGPSINGYWGDFARSLVIEDGRVVENPMPNSSELVKIMFKSIRFEDALHKKVQQIAHPDMTFDELYENINRFIIKSLYKNLDFKGNLGHSIERSLDDRIYIEKGEKRKLSDVKLFTFEPHIQIVERGIFGYKKEDIYYFSEGVLTRL